MKITIDGKAVSTDSVTYQELGRGRTIDTPMYEYRLTIPMQLVLQKFSDDFEQFKSEIADDFLITGDRQPECYFNADNPNLDQCICNHPECLAEIINDYLFVEFFEAVLPKNGRIHHYLIREVSNILKEGDGLQIAGWAYTLR